MLRMGMVGGGTDSLMGGVHRTAARMTGRIELVSGAFSSNRQKSSESGEAIGLPRTRVYGAYRDMLRKEAQLGDDARPDFISIVAPNNMHYPIAMAALDAGFNILCESPMTTSMDEALNLKRKLVDKGLEFCLTFSYSAYPMIKQARTLIQQNAIGNIRKVAVMYPQGWLATRLETAGNKQAGWRTDPRRVGPSGCMADIGTHCVHLAEFVTGLSVKEVCADLRAFIPGRPLDDDGAVLLHFSNGAHGVIWASQVCIGQASSLRIMVYGDKGGIEWQLDHANLLTLHTLTGPTQVFHSGGPGVAAANKTPFPLPRGQTECFLVALTTLYHAFANRIEALADNKTKEVFEYPTVDAGIAAMAFVDAVVRNVKPENTNKWTPLVTA